MKKPIDCAVKARCVELGIRIKQRRMAMNLTLQEVGERMTPPKLKQQVYRIEIGHTDTELGDLRQIAAILGTSMQELLQDVQLSTPGNPTISSLLEIGWEIGRSPECLVKQFKQGDPHAL